MKEITCTNITPMGITENPIPMSYRDKETIFRTIAIAYDHEAPKNMRFRRPVVAQFYMGRSPSASVVYCTVHVSNDDLHSHGHGKAGGYGYDKKSAALANALSNAGISLSQSIHGTGRDREAVEAIARYLYPKLDIEVIE